MIKRNNEKNILLNRFLLSLAILIFIRIRFHDFDLKDFHEILQNSV